MPKVPLPQGIGTCGSPRCQEAMGGSIAQTRSERVSTPSYDSPILGVHTPGSDEEIFEQHELTGNVQQQSNDPPLLRGHTLRSGIQDWSRFGNYKIEIESQEAGKEEEKGKNSITPAEEIGRHIIKKIKLKINWEFLVQLRYLQMQLEKMFRLILEEAFSTGSGGINTASRLFSTAEESVSTAGVSMPVSTAGMVQEVNISIPSPVAVKDKVVRLQEELGEEERQRMARVHKAAQSLLRKNGKTLEKEFKLMKS
uniref:Uncharacterized protein n=1 Tax=Tanacetum cinerariifolium TaxID=118510 RepID=A0A699L6P4_TANCI|nr:hypothetical protein [Tanacetum cinerariifolium]